VGLKSRATFTPFVPATVGRFEVLLPIGTGGMARVYLARASGLAGFERDVALKLVEPTEIEETTSLLDEARLAARIRHPNVVPVFDVGEDPAGVFLVMEYIEGDSLSGLTKGRHLPLPIALRILTDALAGLAAAHELRGPDGALLHLVHRDFSPQNILVGVDGITRLTDFGIAKAASRTTVTKTGVFKGKIGYVSPEHARGQVIDERSDLWSAGVVAWELVAGRRLFHGEEVPTLMRIVMEDPPRLRTACSGVNAVLEDIVAAALTRDVSARVGSAEDLRERLLTCGERVADATEVAAYVRGVTGPLLDARRAKVQEILRARAEPADAVSGERSVQHVDIVATSATVDTVSASVTRPMPAREPRHRRRALGWMATGAAVLAMGVTAIVAATAHRTESLSSSASGVADREPSVALPPQATNTAPAFAASPHASATSSSSVAITVGALPSRTPLPVTAPAPRSRRGPLPASTARAPAAVTPAAPGLPLVANPYEKP